MNTRDGHSMKRSGNLHALRAGGANERFVQPEQGRPQPKRIAHFAKDLKGVRNALAGSFLERNQARNRFAMARDHQFFPCLRTVKPTTEPVLGFKCRHGFHFFAIGNYIDSLADMFSQNDYRSEWFPTIVYASDGQ
jgi:hypothetical protein